MEKSALNRLKEELKTLEGTSGLKLGKTTSRRFSALRKTAEKLRKQGFDNKNRRKVVERFPDTVPPLPWEAHFTSNKPEDAEKVRKYLADAAASSGLTTDEFIEVLKRKKDRTQEEIKQHLRVLESENVTLKDEPEMLKYSEEEAPERRLYAAKQTYADTAEKHAEILRKIEKARYRYASIKSDDKLLEELRDRTQHYQRVFHPLTEKEGINLATFEHNLAQVLSAAHKTGDRPYQHALNYYFREFDFFDFKKYARDKEFKEATENLWRYNYGTELEKESRFIKFDGEKIERITTTKELKRGIE